MHKDAGMIYNLKGNILKGLMFVGANASGKSNAVIAIKFLLDCLFGKLDVNMAAYMCLFSENPEMSLTYTFDIEGTEIIYEIKYQRIDKKLNENLWVNGENIFTRDGSVAKIKFSEEKIYTDVPKGILFLRDIYFNTKFRGQEKLQKWFDFLRSSVYLDLYSGEAIQYRDVDLSLKSYLEQEGTEEINNFFQEYNFGQIIEYEKNRKGM